MVGSFVTWLIAGGVGPALVDLPVTWGGDAGAVAARLWFRRLRRTDDLSRLVLAATGVSVELTRDEFGAVRRLLEDKETWRIAGRGTVEDLATKIASCLQTPDGRVAGDVTAAARTIARGLLEFGVADLDRKVFQQVLLARLQRLEGGLGSALDGPMLRLHADLAANFDEVVGRLGQVLDRLPSGPAGRGEIAVYLKTLIGWLGSDPWPRDQQFHGPVLAPAAIERKLRVTATGGEGSVYLDADELTRQRRRLVILGGPGSGKTWLAKRAARRCAENALEALSAGSDLDEVELPLYTTCSRLFSARGGIRDAVVSSALDQISDLGGLRISEAVRVFFMERNAPTVLLIDSLDEARGSDERLRQADTLRHPWRIVLTSRPSSWNQQLAVDEKSETDLVGELQPLGYPDDVEAFIHSWFTHQPDRGSDLAAQIAQRPSLQQAATVPLILGFYCILGGSEPLPEFRRDLFTRVLNRMLTGRWRTSDDRRLDKEACLATLRAWAWAGATSHPVSGVGTWSDDIATGPCRLGQAEQDALDHVATPLAAPDIDKGTTLRRFIHRSLREHLVAEHVASLTVDRAVEALLSHLWYDPDWEYSAPASIATHPQRDQILRNLIRRAAISDHIPGDISLIDARWEFRRLLAQIATESSEADWSSENAQIIGHARVKLALSGRIYDVGRAAYWKTSNRKVCQVLFGLLAGQTDGSAAGRIAGAVVQLATAEEDKHLAVQTLLALLARQADGWAAGEIAGAVVQLATAEEDKHLAVQTLVALLARQAAGWGTAVLQGAVAQLAMTADHKRLARQALLPMLADQADGRVAADLAGVLAQLDPTPADKSQARQALLSTLAHQSNGQVAAGMITRLVQLATSVEEQRQARQALLSLLANQAHHWVAGQLADAVVELAATPDDKRQAAQALIKQLAHQTDRRLAAELARAIERLDLTSDQNHQVAQALITLLSGQTHGSKGVDLADRIVGLDPTADDKRQARHALLALILARQTSGRAAAELASRVVQLDPTAEDKRQALDALLGLLASQTNAGVAAGLAGRVVQLDPTAEDKRQALDALLGLLASQTNDWVTAKLARALARLDPTAQDKSQVQQLLLAPLTSQTYGRLTAETADAVVQLATTAEDRRQALNVLLSLMGGQADGHVAAQLTDAVVQLATAPYKGQCRQVLLSLLASQADGWVAAKLASAIAQLDPTAEDKHQACQVLLSLLTGQINDLASVWLAEVVTQFAASADDKLQARQALLELLVDQTNDRIAAGLVDAVLQLDPTACDISAWHAWAITPSLETLAAVRRNSELGDWLTVLPSLASLSG